MSTFQQLCDQAEAYADNVNLLIILAVKSAMSAVGLAGFIVVYKRQRLTNTFHCNARLLLRFHIAFVILSSMGILIPDGYNFIHYTVVRWLRNHKDCPVTPMSQYFTILRMLKLTGYDGSTYTAAAWVLERVYATMFTHSYEKKCSALGWALSCTATAAALIGTAVRISLGDYSMPIPVMMITGSSYKFNMTVQTVAACVEVFNVLILLILLVINRRRLRKSAGIARSLTTKYQIRENVLATSLILPLALLHCLLYFPAAIVMPLVTKQGLSPYERVILFANSEWLVVYSLALPLLLWWRNGVKKSHVESLVRNNLIGEKYKNDRKEGKVETAKYFEMFNQMLA
ncbi:hypothetical protein QR680_010998 [Steinernema hermaphroditum]|uniref:Uncharacterized protein n=1 Tax=Steinernema hermaphroditum TaxID=289476 RepID=A0AA39MCH0_9BILA|nr:hypothetical protein QR680_010998 [Steinernema hermaphroditum]